MNQEITYTQVGDYLLPDLILEDSPNSDIPPLGRYGHMRRAFLKEHCLVQYNILLLTGRLFSHLREVDVIAEQRRKNGTPEYVIIEEIVCEY